MFPLLWLLCCGQCGTSIHSHGQMIFFQNSCFYGIVNSHIYRCVIHSNSHIIIPVHIFFFKASSINPNRLSASFFLDVHISNNWDTTLPSFMSKTRTSKGFNLTNPSSFDPSVHKAHGPYFIPFTSFDIWKNIILFP